MGSTSVSVADERPVAYQLEQNYPNPFNPQTTIRYALAESGSVEIVVYDMLGRHVTSLVNAIQQAGDHEVVFNAEHLPNGMYMYRLVAGSYTRNTADDSPQIVSYDHMRR